MGQMKKTKKKRRAAFGMNTERFMGQGYHPNLEYRPITRKYSNLFPGAYNWSSRPQNVPKVISWTRQIQEEEYSRRLGYNSDHILKKRAWFQSINGPGWHSIPKDPVKGITFPKGERFPVWKRKGFDVPGPGTYGKNHIPYMRIEEKSHDKGFSHSILPPFERVGNKPRSLVVERSYHLPPNLYTIKSSTDELISKIVSKRGPYDLFTGPRFSRTAPRKGSEKVRVQPLAVSLSDWNHPKNASKGKFMRCGKESLITCRLILKDPSCNVKKNIQDPGPDHYDPYPAKTVTQSLYPFNKGVVEERSKKKSRIYPPPGRYQTEVKRRIRGDGMKSVFLSKTQRKLPQAEKVSWFE